MKQLDFTEILSRSEFRNEPFPHWICHQILDAETLERIEKEYPSSKENYEMLSNSNSNFGPFDQNTAYPLEFDQVDEKSGYLSDFTHSWYSQKVPLLDYISPYLPLDLRKNTTSLKEQSFSRGDFRTTSPATISGTTQLGPHLDSPYEILAGLIYLRNPKDSGEGGNLQIYALKNNAPKRYMSEKRRVPLTYLHKIEEIPYGRNVGIFFLSHPRAIHGVSSRGISSYDRRVINLSIELPDQGPIRMFDPNQITDWSLTGKSRLKLLRKIQNKLARINNSNKRIGFNQKNRFGKYNWVREADL